MNNIVEIEAWLKRQHTTIEVYITKNMYKNNIKLNESLRQASRLSEKDQFFQNISKRGGKFFSQVSNPEDLVDQLSDRVSKLCEQVVHYCNFVSNKKELPDSLKINASDMIKNMIKYHQEIHDDVKLIQKL